MPRSGSKRSQEGFARDKPPETSRKEIKDASHRASSDSAVTAPYRRVPAAGGGGGGGRVAGGKREGGDGGRREEGGGKEGSPFNYPTLNSLSG